MSEDEREDRDRLPKLYDANFLHFICVVCTVVCFWQMAESGWEIAPTAENPLFGPSAKWMVYTGAQVTGCMLSKGQWWRLLSSQFLHAGFLHLFGNLLTLLLLGKHLEESFGWQPIAVIYIASGFAGALSTAIWLPESVGVGASGAILGLHGAEWADLLMNFSFQRPARGALSEAERKERVCMLSVMTITITLSGLFPFINFFAHLAGLICGFLLGLGLLVRKRYGRDGILREWKRKQWLAAGCGLALFICLTLVQVVIIGLADDISDLCDNYVDCHPRYLCINTPRWPCSSSDDMVCGYTWNHSIVISLECLDGAEPNANATGAPPVFINDTVALRALCEDVCGWYCAHPGAP